MGSKSSPTWLRRVHRGERGRLARGEVLSLNEARERRRRHSTQSAGKPRTGGRTPGDERSQGLIAALCLMKFGSTSCHRGRGAAVNATEMTTPVVTLGAEVNATEMTTPVVTLGAEVNPWRAVCAEKCKHGSEGEWGNTVRLCALLLPYPCWTNVTRWIYVRRLARMRALYEAPRGSGCWSSGCFPNTVEFIPHQSKGCLGEGCSMTGALTPIHTGDAR